MLLSVFVSVSFFMSLWCQINKYTCLFGTQEYRPHSVGEAALLRGMLLPSQLCAVPPGWKKARSDGTVKSDVPKNVSLKFISGEISTFA